MPELSLIPTKDLIEELLARHDHAMFVGMKVGIGHKDKYFMCRRWKGNEYIIRGMAFEFAHVVTNDKLLHETSVEDELG